MTAPDLVPVDVAKLSGSGVDTVSFAFRSATLGFRALDGFMAQPHRPSAAGALLAADRAPGGGRLLAFPQFGVLALETRLGALLAGDAENHELLPAQRMVAGEAAARLALADHIGLDPGRAEVRRYDLAAELRFEAGSDGLAFLRHLDGFRPPRSITSNVVGVDGQVQTVYVRTPRRGVVLSRAYDKGVESGSDLPGHRVRIESQNRPPKAKRQSPQTLAERDLRPIFGRTMAHYLGPKEVIVAGCDGATAELVAKVMKGELTHSRAESLLGAVTILKWAGRAAYDVDGCAVGANNRRSARRLAALRDAGVVLEHELPPEAMVPVSGLLRCAIEEFAA